MQKRLTVHLSVFFAYMKNLRIVLSRSDANELFVGFADWSAAIMDA